MSATSTQIATNQEVSGTEKFICKMLCVSTDVTRAEKVKSNEQAPRIFSISIAISGLRCILSYVLFPFILPFTGLATTSEPYLGIPIGVIALIFDVMGIRRFWAAKHKYRWIVSFVYLAVMIMVAILVGIDIHTLAK
ncbi:MAG: hypothetical protein HKL80_07570 [Acidimicrobiales bacterium]|nr:hypothetical protein [Acidimicrobiales bacterium]